MSLPNNFQVYTAPDYSPWAITKVYHLGTTTDTPPLYTCKETVSWSGKLTINLREGSTAGGALVANLRSESVHQSRTVITIFNAGYPGNEQTGELFRRHDSLKHETWDLVVAVVTGNQRRADKFEWRRSHGDETASLPDGRSTHSWELFRLRSGDSTSADVGDGDRVLEESSDVKEVVAVWAVEIETRFRLLYVEAKLEFTGSGAATGEGGLGKHWKLCAAMSALHIRQLNLHHATAASTTTAAAVGAFWLGPACVHGFQCTHIGCVAK
jgi:hypothetical protein